MRSFPGSVAIIGFTGEVKFITRVGGFVSVHLGGKVDGRISDKQSPRVFVKITGAPRKRCSKAGRELSGTSPRPFSSRKLRGKIEILSVNPRPRLARSKFALHTIETQAARPAHPLDANRPQRLQDFEQDERSQRRSSLQRSVSSLRRESRPTGVSLREPETPRTKATEETRKPTKFQGERVDSRSATPAHRSSSQSAAWDKSRWTSAA